MTPQSVLILDRIRSTWNKYKKFTAVYADGSTKSLQFPSMAEDKGLIGVYSKVSMSQLKDDFAAAGILME